MSDTPTTPSAQEPPSEDRAGAVLGLYTLIKPLGEGGFGKVWVAEQSKPVKRQVALKVVKAGMGSRDVLARFQAERQALAVMDHPGIAKVLDAGSTPGGQPYFVMELVNGRRITSYADHATLDLRARLELFQHLCHAVQHAHQKGIVHRDLKPDNVLVADDDGRPVPRVIDFGIAKAMTAPLTESTLQTGAHQIMGTPAYMAPEQAQRSADVDTRADVYSLGALLYELLSGARPFELSARGTTTLEDVLRHIREVDPAPPSARVLTHEEPHRRGVAAWRGTTPERLSRALRGDLDWIVGRALEKERDRRYPTVAALADDVARHLADEPVEAGPPTTAYRLTKLVRRHRGAAAGVMLGSVSLLVALAVLIWSVSRVSDERDAAQLARENEAGARRVAEAARDEARAALDLAEQRRREAEDSLAASHQVTSFLQHMLHAVSPSEYGREATVREVLDRVAPSLGKHFAARPLVEAELRFTVGGAYHALGLQPEAREHLTRAVALSTSVHGADHPDTLSARQQLALVDWTDSRLASAAQEMEHVHAALLAAVGPDDPRRLDALNVLAIAWFAQGRWQEAHDAWRELLTHHEARLGPEDTTTLMVRHNLGMVLNSLGHWDQAERELRSCLELYTRDLGPRHPDTLSTLNDLTIVSSDRGDWLAALPMQEQLLEARREVLGDEHPLTLGTLINLAASAWQLGRLEQASALAREAEAGCRRVLGARNESTLMAVDLLGTLAMDREQLDEAERLTREAYEGRLELLGPDHPDTLISLQNMGALRQAQGRLAQAAELYQELAERRAATFGPEHERTLRAHYLVANALYHSGAAYAAEPRLRELLETCTRVLGADNIWTVDVEADLAWSLLDLGRFDEAEEHLYAVHEARSELLGPDHALAVNALEGLARLYRDAGREAELLSVSRALFVHARRMAESPDAKPFELAQLAWYLCEGPLEDVHDPPEALVWAERANAATNYAVPRYLDGLADARYANGDVQGALDAHLKALSTMAALDPMRGYHEELAEFLQAELAGADH